jgi:hypothetical protein
MDEGDFPKPIEEEYLSPDMILSDSDNEVYDETRNHG